MIGVFRDGKKETFRVENVKGGKRVYIGHPEIYLPYGKYSYKIIYYTYTLIC